jgi:hypothetical protein
MKLSVSLPTGRQLEKPGKYVLSTEKDGSVWKGVHKVAQCKIYDVEVILTGTLRQEVDWDSKEFLVKGSY